LLGFVLISFLAGNGPSSDGSASSGLMIFTALSFSHCDVFFEVVLVEPEM
jgi:hypothetical protein